VTLIHFFLTLATLVSLAGIIHPFKPFLSRRNALLSFSGFFFINVIIFATSSLGSTKHQTAEVSSSEPASSEPNQASSASNSQPQNWIYSSSTDGMTGQISKLACVKSSNELQFSSPYNGGAIGELCFRRKGHSLNAYVDISTGQFNSGIDEAGLKLKFDDGAIQRFSAEEATTHESGFLFISSEPQLLASTLKAKKLKLQAEYFEEGEQVSDFDVSGLDPKRF